jgi:hypothetical protein
MEGEEQLRKLKVLEEMQLNCCAMELGLLFKRLT